MRKMIDNSLHCVSPIHIFACVIHMYIEQNRRQNPTLENTIICMKWGRYNIAALNPSCLMGSTED